MQIDNIQYRSTVNSTIYIFHPTQSMNLIQHSTLMMNELYNIAKQVYYTKIVQYTLYIIVHSIF